MSDQTDTIFPFLAHLGLSPEEGKIYLYLRQNGDTTALSISKNLHLGRTRVYRILDSLKANHLVEYKIGSRGLSFLAANPSSLELLLTKKREEISGLETSLAKVIDSLNTIPTGTNQVPKTIYYEGLPGLLAMTWNTLEARGDGIRIWELTAEMSKFIPPETSEDIRREFVRRNIQVKQLTNLKELSGWTRISEFVKNFWQVRHISPGTLNITFEIAVYNDIVAMYTYKEKVPYCVELHDPALAQMHRQMFDLSWENAAKMRIIDDSGAAVLDVQV